jgi:hypothetical protein
VLQRGADGGVQLGDGVDAAGGSEVEGELIHYLMVTEGQAMGGLPVVPEMCVYSKTAIACFSFRPTSTWKYAS